MKYLGVDFGTKRIGLAVSDDGGKIAFPRITVANDSSAIKKIKSLIKKESILKIVIGLPLTVPGEDTETSKRVRSFSAKLHKNVMLPVDFEDELLTTKIAEKTGKKNADAKAAAIILQSYLDRKK